MGERDVEIRMKEQEAFGVLRRRFKLREAGSNKWDALCPAHDDNNRSLRVYRVNDRMYFKCYAGCTFNDVRAALGLPIFKNNPRRATSYRPRILRRISEDRTPPAPGAPVYDYQALADTFLADEQTLAPLADELGLPIESLADADVGWIDGFPMYSHARRGEVPIAAWSWPMCDGGGNTIGLRLRFRDGNKRSFTGSHPGLFIGKRWGMPGPVLVVEGPTDRAAGFAWGFDTIGKPSCNDGDDYVEEMVLKVAAEREIIILSQVDEPKTRPESGELFWPGQEGAEALADRLVWKVKKFIRVITPPPGIKDARRWWCSGGTRGDVDAMIRSKGRWRPTRGTR